MGGWCGDGDIVVDCVVELVIGGDFVGDGGGCDYCEC